VARTVDLFADIVCPWCLIGSRRLEQVLLGAPDVQLVYRPFFLMPDTPAEGVNVPAMLRAKYGRDPRSMFDAVEAQARDSGIALDLTKQPMSYPTVKAHTLLRHALARGTQRRLATDLYNAYFLEAQNVADDGVLASIAAKRGFTADEARHLVRDPAELELTRAEADQAASRGIRGVPFFVFNSRLAVSGAQPVEVLKEALEEASQP
jgi:predicted DsbA family dithiol-disulfide isomerase